MRRAIPILAIVGILMAACAATPVQSTPPRYETGVDSEAWATIPAGEFLYGQHDERIKIDTAYDVMITDVTNRQFARYLNKSIAEGKIKIANHAVVGPYPGDRFAGRRHEKKIEAGDYTHLSINDKDSRLAYDGKTFTVQPGFDDHPVVAVTWFGAKAYCDYYGWHLPTETQWEKAARGTDGRAYPWGNDFAPNRANAYGSHDPFEKEYGAQGTTTPVGFYNGKLYDGYQTDSGTSPYGLYDMAGNVWQWTADIYEGMHYRSMRGGSKGEYEYNLRVWSRNSAEPDYGGPTTGFRCARNSTR